MNSSNRKKLPEEVRKAFPEDQREMMEELWDLCEDTDRANIDGASESEIEEELGKVKDKAGISSEKNKSYSEDNDTTLATEQKISPTGAEVNRKHWQWLAAAAVLVIMLAGGLWYYLQQPVEISAGRGEMVEATLPDGSAVELNSGSSVVYSRSFGDDDRNIELNGEAYFNVVEGEHNFLVETHDAMVRVTGTSFNVRSWHREFYRETSVMMESGSAEFVSRANPDQVVLLRDGYFSTLKLEDLNPSEPEERSAEDVMAWRYQDIRFSGEPMSFIVDELERRFDVNIDVEDAEMLELTHSLYMSEPESAENVLQTLSQRLDFDYEITDDRYVIHK